LTYGKEASSPSAPPFLRQASAEKRRSQNNNPVEMTALFKLGDDIIGDGIVFLFG